MSINSALNIENSYYNVAGAKEASASSTTAKANDGMNLTFQDFFKLYMSEAQSAMTSAISGDEGGGGNSSSLATLVSAMQSMSANEKQVNAMSEISGLVKESKINELIGRHTLSPSSAPSIKDMSPDGRLQIMYKVSNPASKEAMIQLSDELHGVSQIIKIDNLELNTPQTEVLQLKPEQQEALKAGKLIINVKASDENNSFIENGVLMNLKRLVAYQPEADAFVLEDGSKIATANISLHFYDGNESHLKNLSYGQDLANQELRGISSKASGIEAIQQNLYRKLEAFINDKAPKTGKSELPSISNLFA